MTDRHDAPQAPQSHGDERKATFACTGLLNPQIARLGPPARHRFRSANGEARCECGHARWSSCHAR
jgi:hypothetical protein